MDPVLDPELWVPPVLLLIWGILVVMPAAFVLLALCGAWNAQWSPTERGIWRDMLVWGSAGAAAVAAFLAIYTAAYYLVTLAVTLTEGITT